MGKWPQNVSGLRCVDEEVPRLAIGQLKTTGELVNSLEEKAMENWTTLRG